MFWCLWSALLDVLITFLIEKRRNYKLKWNSKELFLIITFAKCSIIQAVNLSLRCIFSWKWHRDRYKVHDLILFIKNFISSSFEMFVVLSGSIRHNYWILRNSAWYKCFQLWEILLLCEMKNFGIWEIIFLKNFSRFTHARFKIGMRILWIFSSSSLIIMHRKFQSKLTS